MNSHCSVGVCSSPVHCQEIGRCFSAPAASQVPPACPGVDERAAAWDAWHQEWQRTHGYPPLTGDSFDAGYRLAWKRAYGVPSTEAAEVLPGRITEWPKERSVGRREDMSPTGKLQVMLDGDSDVIVHVCKGDTAESWESASIEFCTVGQGGGSSPRTRAALIALMVAIEADNAESPRKAWPPAEGRTAGTPIGKRDGKA